MVGVSSCSKPSPEQEVIFRIDEELLGETYSDSLLAIEMRIPVSWRDISEELRVHLDQLMFNGTEEFEEGLFFKKGFGNREQGSFMLLFDFAYQKIDADKEKAVLKYLAHYSEGKEVYKQGFFEHNEISFHQLTSGDNGVVNIKLLAYGINDSVFALDFFVPETEYLNNIEKIESSIGSITKKEWR
jgi:hypothetical protein